MFSCPCVTLPVPVRNAGRSQLAAVEKRLNKANHQRLPGGVPKGKHPIAYPLSTRSSKIEVAFGGRGTLDRMVLRHQACIIPVLLLALGPRPLTARVFPRAGLWNGAERTGGPRVGSTQHSRAALRLGEGGQSCSVAAERSSRRGAWGLTVVRGRSDRWFGERWWCVLREKLNLSRDTAAVRVTAHTPVYPERHERARDRVGARVTRCNDARYIFFRVHHFCVCDSSGTVENCQEIFA